MRRFLWEHFVETTHHTLCFYNSVIITRTLLTSKQHGVPNNHGRRSECPNKCFIGSTNKSSSRDCGKTASQCGQNFKFLQARASQLFLQHLYLKKREVHSLNPSNLISCIGSAEKWSGKHVFLFRLICKTVNNGEQHNTMHAEKFKVTNKILSLYDNFCTCIFHCNNRMVSSTTATATSVVHFLQCSRFEQIVWNHLGPAACSWY